MKDWLNDLKSAVRRRDLISERELEDQAAEMFSTIVDVPAGSNLEDFSGSDWQPLREMLASLSVALATSGFTPSETAIFLLPTKGAN